MVRIESDWIELNRIGFVVLYWIVLDLIVLGCIVLYCIVMYWIGFVRNLLGLVRIGLHWIALFCFGMDWIVFYRVCLIVLDWIGLDRI